MEEVNVSSDAVAFRSAIIGGSGSGTSTSHDDGIDSSSTNINSSTSRVRIIPEISSVVAPMINQSDAPFRVLTRRHGAATTYTEMLYSALLAAGLEDDARCEEVKCEEAKDKVLCEVMGGKGGGIGQTKRVSSYLDMKLPEIDHSLPEFKGFSRPLIAQVCGNDPYILALATKVLCQSGRVDAIDLNLGCPQEVAKINMFGSYLLDKHLWPLVFRCVSAMSEVMKSFELPLFCKIRICEGNCDEDRFANTLAFCEGLVSSGADVITIHGRLRGSPRHRRHGPADLKMIDRIAAALSGKAPVVSNGNIVLSADISGQMRENSSIRGFMSAEGVLIDPALFAPVDWSPLASRYMPVDMVIKRPADGTDGSGVSVGGDADSGKSINSSRVDRNQLFQEYCDLMDAYFKAGGFSGESPSPLEKMMYTARQHLTWMLEKIGHGRSVRFIHLGSHFKKHFQLLTAVNESKSVDDLRAISAKCLVNVFGSTPYDPNRED